MQHTTHKRWTVELHETESGSWVGVVKQRGGDQGLSYMSEYQVTATFAFTDCLNWIKCMEGLEQECGRLSEGGRPAAPMGVFQLAS